MWFVGVNKNMQHAWIWNFGCFLTLQQRVFVLVCRAMIRLIFAEVNQGKTFVFFVLYIVLSSLSPKTNTIHHPKSYPLFQMFSKNGILYKWRLALANRRFWVNYYANDKGNDGKWGYISKTVSIELGSVDTTFIVRFNGLASTISR